MNLSIVKMCHLYFVEDDVAKGKMNCGWARLDFSCHLTETVGYEKQYH